MSRRMFDDDELFQLITECRNSGLSDFQWCKEHGIKNSTFYSWIARLRKKGTVIPDSAKRHCPVPVRNEVVKVDLVPDTCPICENELEQNAPFSRSISTPCNPTVEITAGTLCIRLTNDVHPDLLGTILSAIGGNAHGR